MQTITTVHVDGPDGVPGNAGPELPDPISQFSSTCGQDSSWQVNEFYRSMAEEKGAYCRSSLYPERSAH